MKQYTLCAVILACVVCNTSGCGKTEYDNAFQNRYADCTNSGGEYREDNSGEFICFCNSTPCYNNICNPTTRECGECTDGEEKCDAVNSKFLICEEKKWRDTGKTCKVDDINATDCKSEPECDGKYLIQCVNNQPVGIECVEGCDNDKKKCKMSCMDNQKKCSGDYLEICVNDNNENKITRVLCPFGCDAKKHECIASTFELCNTEEEKCEVNTFSKPIHYKCVAQEKSDKGEQLPNTWEVYEICESDSCDVQMKTCGCGDGNEKYECEGEQLKYSLCKEIVTGSGYTKWESSPISPICKGNILYSCNDSSQLQTLCKFGCNNGECNICQPGIKMCDITNSILVECNETGNWNTLESCKFGCNDNGLECNECQDGEIKCIDNAVAKCVDGVWRTTECSESQVCFEGICKECMPYTKICEGDHKRECDASGNWMIEQKCELGCKDGYCECDSAEWQKKCDDTGNVVLACINNQLINISCSFGCINGECYQKCEENAQRCEIVDNVATLLKCIDSKWKVDRKCDFKTCNSNSTDCGCNINKKRTECDNNTKMYKETECVSIDNTQKYSIETTINTECYFGCNDNGCNMCENNSYQCTESDQIEKCVNDSWTKTGYQGVCTDNKMNLQHCESGKLMTMECDLGCDNEQCNKCVNASPECIQDKAISDDTGSRFDPFDSTDKKSTSIKYCEKNKWVEYIDNCQAGCYAGECLSTRDIQNNVANKMVRCENKELKQYVDNEWITINDSCGKIKDCVNTTNGICKFNDNMVHNNSYDVIDGDVVYYNNNDNFDANDLERQQTNISVCLFGFKLGDTYNKILPACYSQCAPNQFRCLDNVLQKCVIKRSYFIPYYYTTWQDEFLCKNNTECAADLKGCIQYNPDRQICNPDTFDSECTDKIMSTCSSDYQFEDNPQMIDVYCSYQCIKNGQDVYCGECTNDQYSCNVYGNLDICKDGKWERGENGNGYLTCPKGCDVNEKGESVCIDKKCTPGQSKCTEDYKIRLECDTNGFWTIIDPCIHKKCKQIDDNNAECQ